MHFETVSLFDIILYHLVSYFLFRLALFCTFCNFFQRYLPFPFAELNFYVDMSVGFFVGKHDQRLDVLGLRKHIKGLNGTDLVLARWRGRFD